MIARTLGRMIVVPLAALFGAGAALTVLLTLGLERFTHATYGQNLDVQNLSTALDWALAAWQWLSAPAVLPALLVLVIGEVAGIRSWLYYVIGCGAALACLPLLTAFDRGVVAALPAAAVWQVLATAGFAGGLTYWLIAGRNA